MAHNLSFDYQQSNTQFVDYCRHDVVLAPQPLFSLGICWSTCPPVHVLCNRRHTILHYYSLILHKISHVFMKLDPVVVLQPTSNTVKCSTSRFVAWSVFLTHPATITLISGQNLSCVPETQSQLFVRYPHDLGLWLNWHLILVLGLFTE